MDRLSPARGARHGHPLRTTLPGLARILIGAGLTVFALTTAIGCAPADRADSGSGTLRAVATTSLVGDLVTAVGREMITLTTLMGPGVDPHLYRASEGDVRTLSSANVIFYNGLHLEAKMGEVLEQMQGRIRTVAVTDGIPRDRLLSPPEFAGSFDPHVWFDPQLWTLALEQVTTALIELRPADSAAFRANAIAYADSLTALHNFILTRAAEIPAADRVIVTAHDAFNYFGRAYGFEVRGLQGISTAAEAGAADVRELAQFIADRKIPAIFVESSVPRRSVEAVQAAVAARGFNVRLGGELFSDALGDAASPEGNYIGMTRHNVNTIVTALQGSDPPRL